MPLIASFQLRLEDQATRRYFHAFNRHFRVIRTFGRYSQLARFCKEGVERTGRLTSFVDGNAKVRRFTMVMHGR